MAKGLYAAVAYGEVAVRPGYELPMRGEKIHTMKMMLQ